MAKLIATFNVEKKQLAEAENGNITKAFGWCSESGISLDEFELTTNETKLNTVYLLIETVEQGDGIRNTNILCISPSKRLLQKKMHQRIEEDFFGIIKNNGVAGEDDDYFETNYTTLYGLLKYEIKEQNVAFEKEERIINDFYIKKGARQWGEDPTTQYNVTIKAVNDMYGYLYEKGVLQKTAFEKKDFPDAFYFAVDANELEPFRNEMLNSGIKNAKIAVKTIFDEDIHPCHHCGAITLSWTMQTYRDTCGCVSKSWECCGCEGFHTADVDGFAETKEKRGTKAAVKEQWSMFRWKGGAINE